MNPATPLSDAELTELEQLLDSLPAPLEPLDISALDGYLCGVLLQPQPVPASQWLRWAGDVEGQALPPGPQAQRLATLAQRRHAELEQAIAQRQWFDPWVFEVDVEAEAQDLSASDLTLPWVAGFAAAMDRFSGLMAMDHPGLLEPLAILYAGFDPDDLEDADELLAWLATARRAPRQVYLVHGEPDATDTLRQRIEERLGWPVAVPEHLASVELDL